MKLTSTKLNIRHDFKPSHAKNKAVFLVFFSVITPNTTKIMYINVNRVKLSGWHFFTSVCGITHNQ